METQKKNNEVMEEVTTESTEAITDVYDLEIERHKEKIKLLRKEKRAANDEKLQARKSRAAIEEGIAALIYHPEFWDILDKYGKFHVTLKKEDEQVQIKVKLPYTAEERALLGRKKEAK